MEEYRKTEELEISLENSAALEEQDFSTEDPEEEAARALEEEDLADEDLEADQSQAEEEEENTVLPETADPDADDRDLTEVVGVRFRTAGKAYYFANGAFPVKRGTHVIVETARGLEYGTSVCDPLKIHQKQFKAPLKKIVRIATAADDSRMRELREKEREAYCVCFEKIRRHNLDMKLIDAEYTFDNNKILFYFTSDGRVDFRDLVKDLASVFRTRIELRQIGVRDETKILGGYGICGRPLCCHTDLSDFVPVSIKMAKEQNLSLNPTKISGSCGRLMCCLKNEEETYEALNKNLPRLGDEVQTSDGLTGEVAGVNILKQTVRILVEVDDEKELHECAADNITILRRRKRGQAKPKINRNELKNGGSGRPRKEQRPARDPEQKEQRPARDQEQKEQRPARNQEQKENGAQSASGNERRRRDNRPAQEHGTEGSNAQRREENPGSGRSRGRREPAPAQETGAVQGTTAGGGNRRRHRNRRRNGGNDRRREEKPSETE